MKPFYPIKSEIALLLEGRQTAIVRAWKRQPNGEVKNVLQNARYPEYYLLHEELGSTCESSPFGPPGTILWCKEEWWSDWKDKVEKEPCYAYKQSYGDIGVQWNHAVSMPKSACRLWLEVVDVKVCRVQELTNEQTIAFGHYPMPHRCEQSWPFDSHRDAFRVLWNREYGPRQLQWDKNPFVWYATVKSIEKPASI